MEQVKERNPDLKITNTFKKDKCFWKNRRDTPDEYYDYKQKYPSKVTQLFKSIYKLPLDGYLKLSDKEVKRYFRYFDQDSSGFLDHQEMHLLADFMGIPIRLIKEWIKEMDSDGDNQISFNEFFEYLKRTKETYYKEHQIKDVNEVVSTANVLSEIITVNDPNSQFYIDNYDPKKYSRNYLFKKSKIDKLYMKKNNNSKINESDQEGHFEYSKEFDDFLKETVKNYFTSTEIREKTDYSEYYSLNKNQKSKIRFRNSKPKIRSFSNDMIDFDFIDPEEKDKINITSYNENKSKFVNNSINITNNKMTTMPDIKSTRFSTTYTSDSSLSSKVSLIEKVRNENIRCFSPGYESIYYKNYNKDLECQSPAFENKHYKDKKSKFLKKYYDTVSLQKRSVNESTHYMNKKVGLQKIYMNLNRKENKLDSINPSSNNIHFKDIENDLNQYLNQ